MKRQRVALILIVCLLLAACATTGAKDSANTTAWKALMTGKQAYDKAFTALAVMDKQGKLSAKAKDDAIKYGNVYMAAHNQAVQDLLDGKKPNLDVVNAALNQFLAAAAGGQ